MAGGDPEAVRGEHLTAAALAADPGALEVMDVFGWWLALGLANLANVLDPSVIVLGGGLIEAERVVMGPVRRAFDELAEASEARGVSALPAQLGERAGAVGAALLASAGLSAPGLPAQRATLVERDSTRTSLSAAPRVVEEAHTSGVPPHHRVAAVCFCNHQPAAGRSSPCR